MKSKIPLVQRISVKVTGLVLIILLAGIGATVFYYSTSQNSIQIDSRTIAIKEESEVLYTAIKNNMLAGEAPIAVNLFRDFSRMKNRIKLYRTDGVSAFSDNKTLQTVNSNLNKTQFIPKTLFSAREIIDNEPFRQVIKNVDDVFVNDIQRDRKDVVIYKPLFNQPKCSACHGSDHVIRGVLVVSTSVDDVYQHSNENTIRSSIIYGIVVFVLTLAILVFLRRIVINRIFKIGTVVEFVGQGDFKTKIDESKTDEIGKLAGQIDDMIDGLNERFKLTKFVSKSTLDHIKSSDDIRLGGEKKIMTVLFSDIRGFTSFSEDRDPTEVMAVLNQVMNLQAKIVEEFNGDIDKYVGDELMATFGGEDMIIRAVKCGERIIKSMTKRNAQSGTVIKVGIGINTGELISGNMGSGKRMDRTVIGDTVNLGSRLCSLAGENMIVLSEFSYYPIQGKILARKHPPIQVRGKSKAVEIFTLRKTL